MRTLILISIAMLLASAALADTVTADFESGINLGNWTFAGWEEGIIDSGGNPGGWFASGYYWAYWPVFRCEAGSADFTGDFAVLGVTRISGDFTTPLCENGGANGNPFTVLLRNDMGNADPSDDLFVYPDPWNWLMPQIGEGWTHYDFDIPSDFSGGPGELPDGWLGGAGWTGGDIFPSDRTFQEVMSNVTVVEFHWNHPAFFTFDGGWEAGADNIILEYNGVVATQNTSFSNMKSMYR